MLSIVFKFFEEKYLQFYQDYVAQMKAEFLEKLDKIISRKKSNSVYFINELRYQDFIKELKQVKSVKNKSYEDYKFLANYDVLKINGKERLVQPKDETGIIKFYVKTDELFGVLHTMHLLFDHADKDRLDAEIKSKYCNVSKEVVKLYLKCCKKCNS